MTGRAREGVGILLILVVTLALVLFIAGVAQLLFSGQVYRQTARGSGGLTAEYLARSAIAELYYDLQKAVIEPGHPLFKRLREALLTGEEGKAPGGLVDLSREFAIDLLKEELAKSDHKTFFGAFKIDGITVHAGIDRTRPIHDNLIVRLGATARLSLGGQAVSRRVEETRRMGILLAAPKRPFDQVAVAVKDYEFLPYFRQSAEGVREMARLYRLLAAWLAAWKAQVESKPAGAEMSFEMALPDARGGQPRMVSVMLTGELYTFDGLWPDVAGDATAIRVPAPDSHLLVTAGEWNDLAAIDHEQAVSEDLSAALLRLPELAQRIDRVMETFAQVSGRPFSAAEHAAWAAQVGAVGQAVSRDLEILIREMTKVSNLVAPHLKVSPDLNAFSFDQQGRLGPPLYPIAYHVSTQKQFDALFESRKRLNAHVAYQGDAPLVIKSGTSFAGRMVISSEKAPIEVTNIIPASKDEDLVVLAGKDVVFNGGSVTAGVMARGTVKFKGPTVIHGNFVMESLPRLRDRGAEERLSGRVTYNPALFSGTLTPPRDAKNVKWTRYAIGFSPVPEDVEIQWKD